MPTTTDAIAMMPLGDLRTCGFVLRITYRDDAGGTRHFALSALSQCLADTPLGEVGRTRAGMLYPALDPVAEPLGFGPAADGGKALLRFLVDISAALDSGDGLDLDGEWGFTPHPASPLADRLASAGAST